MRKPMMSGHCAFPSTKDHALCRGGNTASPTKEWSPCPCHCHLGDEYACGCERPIREAPLWRAFEDDEDMVYVHIEPTTQRAVGEECVV